MPTDPLRLRDDRRHGVPVTMLIGGRAGRRARASIIAEWGPWADEFAAIEDVEVVKLGTGPLAAVLAARALAETILAAVDR